MVETFVKALRKVSREAWIARLPLIVFAIFLVALPHYPSQDGPSHLLSAATWLAFLGGDPVLRGIFEAHPHLFTNWTTHLFLTGGLALGLAPALVEKIWILIVVASWNEVFVRIGARLGRPVWASLLMLPLLASQPMHLGFWNFLVGTAWGLLAWASRRDGRLGWRGHLLLWLALLAHPFGVLMTLVLSIIEDLLSRKPGRLIAYLPMTLILAFAIDGATRGGVGLSPPDWPDLLGRILTVSLEFGRLEHGLRVAGLLTLLLWLWQSQAEAPPADPAPGSVRSIRPFRWALALGALGLLFLASFAPDAVGEGRLVRERFDFLFWAIALAGLPLGTTFRHRWARPLPILAIGLLIASLVPQASYDFVKARQQRTWLDALSPLAAGELVATVYSSGIADGAYLSRYGAPDLHIGERHLVESGAFNPYNYQARSGHFALRARFPSALELHWAFEHDANALPYRELAPLLDAVILVGLPSFFEETLARRFAPDWQMAFRPEKIAVLRSRNPLPRAHRLDQSWPLAKEKKPVSILLRASWLGPVTVQGSPSHAFWSWRAVLVEADGDNRPEPPVAWIEPVAGFFDEEGKTTVKILAPPPEGLKLGLAVE